MRILLGRAELASLAPSPCRFACPVGTNVQAYIGLIAAGKPEQAAAVIRERNPLPSACGRICYAPCERECLRGHSGEPVAIRALKWFAVEVERERGNGAAPATRPARRAAGRIAVVGGGPAGLTAAHDLAAAGHHVTLFEASDRLGGLLAHGLPAFRLPREALEADVAAILALGFETKLGTSVDLAAAPGLLHEGFDAVILATGADGAGGQLRTVGPEGIETWDAAALVRLWAAGQRTVPGRRLAVLAEAGSVGLAAATARLARRAGAERVLLCAPARLDDWQIDSETRAGLARDGVEIYPETCLACSERSPGGPPPGRGWPRGSHSPAWPAAKARILTSTGGLRFSFGADGPTCELDALVVARPRWPQLAENLPFARTPLGTIAVDPVTLETSVPGVFAAGELSAGPRGVVEAMAAGRRAARSVMRRLGTAPPPPPPPPSAERGVRLATRGGERWTPGSGPLAGSADFDTLDPGLTAPQAVAEARRCLMCGPCEECRRCTPTCEFVLADAALAGQPAEIVRVPRGYFDAASVAKARVRSEAGAGGGDSERPSGVGRGLSHPNAESRKPKAEAGLRSLAPRIVEKRCVACGCCVELCPWNIPRIAPRRRGTPTATIDPRFCRCCGLCTSACPTGALEPQLLDAAHDVLTEARP